MNRSPAPQRFERPESRTPHGWEIALAGDLTDKHADLIEKLLDVAPTSRGTIFFDSPGGSAFVGIALAALIRLRGLDVAGIVLGECSSAALLPFAACPRRFVTAHSSLFFHPVRWSSEDNVMLEEAAEWTRHFKFLENDLDDLLSKLFPLPRATLDSWTRPGRFLTGRELAEAGVAKLLDLFAGDYRQQIR